MITEEEAQEIVYKYAGTGILRSIKQPTVEYVTVEKKVGCFFKKVEWIETDRIQIMHSG